MLTSEWVQDTARWQVDTSKVADSEILVVATGPLSKAHRAVHCRRRTSPGTFHSAAWDPPTTCTTRRVAVIGTGVRVQFIPQIQPQ